MSGNQGNEDRPLPDLIIPGHELMCRIGQGSYGEVWLARSALGHFRAVKIIRRAAFTDDRPYEREFTGLKNFEPVSREHEGLVDILQVERNDAAGYFYCVMELADDASQEKEKRGGGEKGNLPSAPLPLFSSATYKPATLESRLRAEARLPVPECVRIAATLADALRYLHGRGLVHRDIKPGNIIFVDGVPKLADVGLVALAGSARTFVGTEGFVPPEGPGTAKADIFSLGKCVYEMAMGKDRQAFPSPPTLLDELPDRAELLELNEIITRACEPDSRERFKTAGQMLKELELLAQGKSVLESRAKRRRGRLVLCIGAILALSSVAGYLAWPAKMSLAEIRQPMPLANDLRRETLVGDIYGTGEPALVQLNSDRQLSVFTLEGKTLASTTLAASRDESFQLTCLMDVDQNGRELPILLRTAGTNLSLRILNRDLSERAVAFDGYTIPVSYDGKTIYEGYLKILGKCDSLPNEPAQLLVGHSTGGSGLPRDIRCYNLGTGTLLWSTKHASMGPSLALDLDDDGTREWVVVSDSSDNGVSWGGTDDSHTHLFAFDARGKERWRLEVGGLHEFCTPIVVRNRGQESLYALVTTRETIHAQSRGRVPVSGRLMRLSSELKPMGAPFDAQAGIYSVADCEFEPKGPQKLLVTDGHGWLHVLDDELKEENKVRLISPPVGFWVEFELNCRPVDLDGDRVPELIFISHLGSASDTSRHEFPTLHILDTKLREHVRQPLDPQASTNGGWQAYYGPPEADFSRPLTVVGPSNARFFRLRPAKSGAFWK